MNLVFVSNETQPPVRALPFGLFLYPMKFSININQKAVVDNGLDLNLIDLAVFDVVATFSHTEECQKTLYKGKVYYWISWKIIKQQLPLVRLNNRQSVYNRMKKLIQAEVLEIYPNNKAENKSLFCFGINYSKLLFTPANESLHIPANESLHIPVKKDLHIRTNKVIRTNKNNNKESIKKKSLYSEDFILFCQDVIDHLNEVLKDGKYRNTKTNQQLIKKQYDEGFNLEDFQQVQANQYFDWIDSEKMRMFLRPSTLYGSKFQSYLNNKPIKQSEKKELAFEKSLYQNDDLRRKIEQL